jgi:RNA polymerase sigma factor (sigma-70 family)
MDLPLNFENYQDVVFKVISKHYTSAQNDRAGAYDLDDLKQEGRLALLEAMKTYDPNWPDASFFVYAYVAVFKSLAKYCHKNSFPVTVARASDVNRSDEKRVSPEGRDRYKAATKRLLLSDLEEGDWEDAMADTTDPATVVDQLDLTQYCLEELNKQLRPDELGVLSLWACGASYGEISGVIGMSKSQARKIVRALIVKAAGFLKGEIHP